mmetsp:Transcript_21095/g.72943  ORF Transcript_21095/g.72943 Transcript_21095/m.72943 type:complete len:231 (+) Transcript_21095:249-941(+)
MRRGARRRHDEAGRAAATNGKGRRRGQAHPTRQGGAVDVLVHRADVPWCRRLRQTESRRVYAGGRHQLAHAARRRRSAARRRALRRRRRRRGRRRRRHVPRARGRHQGFAGAARRLPHGDARRLRARPARARRLPRRPRRRSERCRPRRRHAAALRRGGAARRCPHRAYAHGARRPQGMARPLTRRAPASGIPGRHSHDSESCAAARRRRGRSGAPERNSSRPSDAKDAS